MLQLEKQPWGDFWEFTPSRLAIFLISLVTLTFYIESFLKQADIVKWALISISMILKILEKTSIFGPSIFSHFDMLVPYVSDRFLIK